MQSLVGCRLPLATKSPHGRKDAKPISFHFGRWFASQLNTEFGRLSPSTRALICFATKCPHGQAVKTSPSHGGIWGSIPHGGTKKSTRIECFFIFHFYFFIFHSPPCLIAHLVCATLLPEPQNTGLTLHYVSKLTRFRYFTIPHGGTKKTSPLRLVFFIRCLQRHVINACVVCNCNRCVSPMSHCTLCVRNFVARNIFSSVWKIVPLCYNYSSIH